MLGKKKKERGGEREIPRRGEGEGKPSSSPLRGRGRNDKTKREGGTFVKFSSPYHEEVRSARKKREKIEASALFFSS